MKEREQLDKEYKELYEPLQEKRYVYIEFAPPGKNGIFIYARIKSISFTDDNQAALTIGLPVIKRKIDLSESRVIKVKPDMVKLAKVFAYDTIDEGMQQHFSELVSIRKGELDAG